MKLGCLDLCLESLKVCLACPPAAITGSHGGDGWTNREHCSLKVKRIEGLS